MRPEMLSEKLIRTDFTVKEFKSVPLAKLSEKFSIIDDDAELEKKTRKRSLKADIEKWKINFPDETGKAKSRSLCLKMEVEELYSRYTNFGKGCLLDYEDDDVLGVKKDFKCFAGYIDHASQALLSDLNLRKYYRNRERNESFDEDSMNRECDQLEGHRGGSPTRNTLSIMDEDVEPSSESVFDSHLSISLENTTPESTLETTCRMSIEDEGIDVNSNISEECSSIMMAQPLSPVPHTIDDTIENTPEDTPIDLLFKFPEPPKISYSSPSLVINFLRLPERRLRRAAVFKLPDELIPKKQPKPEKTAPEPRNFKFEPLINLSADMSSIPTPPSTPRGGNGGLDGEDFIGFEEEDILTSTLRPSLTNEQLDESLDKTIKSRTMSSDWFMSPPDSVRFSCDDQLSTLDLDSGIGTCLSSSEGESSNTTRELTLESIPEEEVGADEGDVEDCNDVSSQDGDEALSDKHKQLQEEAGKRHKLKLQETREITMEVNNWHSILKPILKESHARANFDIHELGTEILNGFVQKEDRTFEDIVQGKSKPDICRYFLSTLLLANTENVRLELDKTRDKSGKAQVMEFKQIRLKFLSAERHHKEMEAMYDEDGQMNKKATKRAKDVADFEEELFERTPKKIAKKTPAKGSPPSSQDSGYMSSSMSQSFDVKTPPKRFSTAKSPDVVRKRIKVC